MIAPTLAGREVGLPRRAWADASRALQQIPINSKDATRVNELVRIIQLFPIQ